MTWFFTSTTDFLYDLEKTPGLPLTQFLTSKIEEIRELHSGVITFAYI